MLYKHVTLSKFPYLSQFEEVRKEVNTSSSFAMLLTR